MLLTQYHENHYNETREQFKTKLIPVDIFETSDEFRSKYLNDIINQCGIVDSDTVSFEIENREQFLMLSAYLRSLNLKLSYENNVVIVHSNNDYEESEIVKVKSVRSFNEKKFSYDVTTESEHFEVSGIYSHNCRTYNGWDINGLGQMKDGRYCYFRC